MSVWDDLKGSLRKIILMEARIDQLAGAVDKLSDQALDHEKRLIRIETMIEIAQSRGGGPIHPEIEGR